MKRKLSELGIFVRNGKHIYSFAGSSTTPQNHFSEKRNRGRICMVSVHHTIPSRTFL